MNYRADLDGIRSIAVSIVILFHFGIVGFSGGFIGVDVFFVLSGYLISSVIFSQLDKGKFEFSHFYFRRVRRLFPVYIVVMLVTFGLCYAFMLPDTFREFGKSLFASTVYVSNILFFLEAGYFDTSSHLKPLLHTWSLSVEEQFYVVFPFVAWITASLAKRWLFALFAVLTLASFIAAVLYLDRDGGAVFYLYPFRAWEMFLGTLLATNFIPQASSRKLNNFLGLSGIALIVMPTFWYTDKTPFPGMSAFLPCFGTALVIYSGQQQSIVREWLSTTVPVFLGKISYSLYLWHWPIFVVYAYMKAGKELSAIDVLIMLVATFLASVLSWKFIETPFREGKVKFSDSKSVVFGATAIVSLLFMFIGFQTYKTNGFPGRLDEATAKFAQAGGDLFGDLSGCKGEDNEEIPGIAYCPIGEPFKAESYTLFWGDSHGGAYKRGYTELVDETKFPAVIAWSGGCPPVFGISKDESVSSTVIDERCPKRNQAIKALIHQETRINAVVLVGRWSYYLNGGGVGVDNHNQISVWPEGQSPESIESQSEFFATAFLETLEALSAAGKKVFVVEQPPEFTQFKALPLAIGLMQGSDDFEQRINTLTVESYDAVLSRQGAIQEVLLEAETRGIVEVLRTHPFFCDDKTCSLMFGDTPTYFDNNHVSSHGAVQINTMFSPLVEYLKSATQKVAPP